MRDGNQIRITFHWVTAENINPIALDTVSKIFGLIYYVMKKAMTGLSDMHIYHGFVHTAPRIIASFSITNDKYRTIYTNKQKVFFPCQVY